MEDEFYAFKSKSGEVVTVMREVNGKLVDVLDMSSLLKDMSAGYAQTLVVINKEEYVKLLDLEEVANGSSGEAAFNTLKIMTDVLGDKIKVLEDENAELRRKLNEKNEDIAKNLSQEANLYAIKVLNEEVGDLTSLVSYYKDMPLKTPYLRQKLFFENIDEPNSYTCGIVIDINTGYTPPLITLLIGDEIEVQDDLDKFFDSNAFAERIGENDVKVYAHVKK